MTSQLRSAKRFTAILWTPPNPPAFDFSTRLDNYTVTESDRRRLLCTGSEAGTIDAHEPESCPVDK